MIRLRFVAIALVGLVGSVVQAQSLPSNGTVYASDFGQWNIPQGTSPTNGSIAWPSMSICRPASQGYTLNPLKVGRKIRILDNRPAASETVTVSATSNNVCSITTTAMSTTHLSYSVTSGTGGLQEAIDSASSLTGGLVVVLTPAWSVLGGTTDMITNASGNASVTILDQRVAKIVPYKWNGTNYVPDPFGSGSGNVNPSPQYRITYYDQPGSQASVLGDVATTDANGGFTVTSLIGKFVSSLAMGKQFRSTLTATDGCANAATASGNGKCYIEDGYTTDAGAPVSASNPVTFVEDDSGRARSQTVVNGVAVGSVAQQYYGPGHNYVADNNIPTPNPGSYTSRPTANANYYSFPTRGRDDNGGTVSQWSVGLGDYSYMQIWGEGIHTQQGGYMYCFSRGDCNGRYRYQYYSGGTPEASAEGNTADGLQLTQISNDVTGTIGSSPTTSKVKLNATVGAGQQGVGRFLLKKNASIYSGNAAINQSYNTYGLMTITTPDANFTPSPWIGSANNVTGHNAPALLDNPIATTFTLTTTSGNPINVAVGDHVCIAATNSAGGEELAVQSVSVTSGSGVGSTVVIGVPSPRRGANGSVTIAKNVNSSGSSIGCAAFDGLSDRLDNANGVTANMMLNTQMAVAFPDANTVLIAGWQQGTIQNIPQINTNLSCPMTVSQTGTTVTMTIATCTGGGFTSGGPETVIANNSNLLVAGTGTWLDGIPAQPPLQTSDVATAPYTFTWTVSGSATIATTAGTIATTNTSSAFNVWPMAIIYNVCDNTVATPSNLRNGTLPPCINGNVDLETNSVNFASGDTFEIPHWMGIRAAAARWALNGYTESSVNNGITVTVGGEAYGGGNPLVNLASSGSFFGTGGRRASPPLGISFRGPNLGTISTWAPSYTRSSGVLYINCASSNGSFTTPSCAKTSAYNAVGMQGATGVSAMRFYPTVGDIKFATPMVKAITRFDSPVGLPTSRNANAWTTQAFKNYTGALFYDSTNNHISSWDNALTVHQLAWKDEVCTTSQTSNCPAGVTSFNTRTGAVTLTASDVNSVGIINNSTHGNADTATTATQVNAGVIPASSPYVGTNASRQFIAAATPLLPANNLSDITNQGTARTNLGLGTMATQNASAVAITGGSGNFGTLTISGTGICQSNGTGCPAAGGTAFNNISSGTNTGATMVVGSGASILHTGTGTIDATLLNGATFQAPSPIGVTTPNVGNFTYLNGSDFTVGAGFTHITNSDDICLNSGLHCSATAGVTYNDVTSSRAYATTYVNSTGHRIRVYWTGFDGGGSHAMLITAFVNGVEIADTNAGATTIGSKFTVSFDVGSGDNYQVTTTNSGGFTAASIGKVVEEQF